MRSLTCFASFLLLGISLFSCNDVHRDAAMATALSDIAQRYESVGMATVVTRGNEIIFENYQGKRNLDDGSPLTADTRVRIASISKVAATLGGMKLKEEGRLNLDVDLKEIIGLGLVNPWFPDDPIHLRDLLSHTASLRGSAKYGDFLDSSYYALTPPHISEILSPDGAFYTTDLYDSLNGPAANHYRYCNLNFGILGTAMEAVSGQRFDRYVQENIFSPLGMRASFNIWDFPDTENTATLYRLQEGVWTPQFDHYPEGLPPQRDFSAYVPGGNGVIYGPQGGMRSSARDLSKMMRMIRADGFFGGKQILKPESLQEMKTPVWEADSDPADDGSELWAHGYGLGIAMTRHLLPGRVLVGHSGSAYGLYALMYYEPAGEIGFCWYSTGGVFGPGTHSDFRDIQEEIAEAVYRIYGSG